MVDEIQAYFKHDIPGGCRELIAVWLRSQPASQHQVVHCYIAVTHWDPRWLCDPHIWAACQCALLCSPSPHCLHRGALR